MNNSTKSFNRIARVAPVLLALMAASIAPSLALDSCENGGWRPGDFREDLGRRYEVLRRDNHLKSEIRHDRGNLDGHYAQLMYEDKAIRAQQQAEAMFNGGYITRGEQLQLNREENKLQRQINRDTRI